MEEDLCPHPTLSSDKPILGDFEDKYFLFVSDHPEKIEAYSKKVNMIACSPGHTLLNSYKFHTMESLEDSPCSDTVYIVHPHEKSEYIPLEKYRQIIFKEKTEELSVLMQRLGAKELSTLGIAGDNNQGKSSHSARRPRKYVFSVPDTNCIVYQTKEKRTSSIFFDLDTILEGLRFYDNQDDWKKCVRLRSEKWIGELTIQIESRDSKEYTAATKIFACGGGHGVDHTYVPAYEGTGECKVTFFSRKDYLRDEICDGLREDKVDHDAKLGKLIKEGIIYAQDESEEWVQCHVVVWERCLTLGFHKAGKKSMNTIDEIMTFPSFEEVVIDILPDNARRSRESKLFAFAIRMENKIDIFDEGPRMVHESKRMKVDVCRDEVILATLNGRNMWEWASAIQWLGTKPTEEVIPLFYKPSTTRSHNKHYEDSQVLQTVLLKMFTYKNLPNIPVTYYNTEHVPPAKMFNFDHETESDISEVESNSGSVVESGDLGSEVEGDDLGSEVESNFDCETKFNSKPEVPFVENHEYAFGKFAYDTILGACVQVNEKCFEMITSSNLYDLSSGGREYNSILSMLCEGDYSTSREYLVKSLWKQGYPKCKGYYACDESFSMNLTKPPHCYGISSPTGQPVHPDDQKLCRLLKHNGDGMEDNIELSKKLVRASKKKYTEFRSGNYKRITSFEIPQEALNWGYTCLKKLSLTNNGIFDLPDSLFDFGNLTHLDLSRNCIFALSHKLGKLTNLENFSIQSNLITELPYTIGNLEKITRFECRLNPITKPPSAVWSRGISNIRKFFKDMEGGKEVNMDLRVLVLGLSEAGKTSLINGLIDPETRALTRVGDRTIGIEKRTWTMERSERNQPVNLLTYDFAGQEEYYITHHLFLGSRALYIIAFDISKYEAHLLDQQILFWWNSIQDRVCDVKSNNSKTPKVVIVGTHADMVKDAQGCADRIQQSLEKRFQLRLKSVHDRLKILKEELELLDPREKADKSDETDVNKKEEQYKLLSAQIKMQIFTKESEVKKLQHQLECTIELPKTIYAVSSMDLRNFDKFKEQIVYSLTETGPSGKYFPHLDEELPTSWFKVRKFIRDQSMKTGYGCMNLSKYFHLLSDELGLSQDVVYRATQFCHELGDVLFFEKEDLVFLRPSLLIDVFKLVIRHDHKESTFWKEEMIEDLQIDEETFNKGMELLLQKGEMEDWLLDVLWSQLENIDSVSNIKNSLIQLLETFDIATPIQHDGCKRLLIPEFQPKLLNFTWQTNKEEGQFESQRWICVNSTLPNGLLKRLQVRMIKKIFKRSDTNGFNLAQNEFLITDTNSTVLYCKSGQGSEEYPGSIISEGIMLYIRGVCKQSVLTLLDKVYICIKNTLKDFPGLIFDHYAVFTLKSKGLSFINLEEVDEKKIAGAKTIKVSSKQNTSSSDDEYVEIDDILPPPKSIHTTFFSAISKQIFDRPTSTADQKNKDNVLEYKSLSYDLGDRKDTLTPSNASYQHSKTISVREVNLNMKKEPQKELLEIFCELGITAERSERIISLLSKGGFNSSKDILESLDGNIQTMDYVLGKEADSVITNDKLKILKWLKDNR